MKNKLFTIGILLDVLLFFIILSLSSKAVLAGCAWSFAHGIPVGLIVAIPTVLFIALIQYSLGVFCHRLNFGVVISASGYILPPLVLVIIFVLSHRSISPEDVFRNEIGRERPQTVEIISYGVVRGIGEVHVLLELEINTDNYKQLFLNAGYIRSESEEGALDAESYNNTIRKIMNCDSTLDLPFVHLIKQSKGKIYHAFWQEKKERLILWRIPGP